MKVGLLQCKKNKINSLQTKWVYRNNVDENKVVSQNKDRLVAQGYNQYEGIDYDETYAPVARLESIRILLAYACALDFQLFQMDIKSAFLNGFSNQEVYVAQPLGFFDFKKMDHVYKLKNALYRLKQAPKACVPMGGPYQTNPPCPDEIKNYVQEEREGPVTLFVTKQPGLSLPYGMLLTRLFKYVMSESPKLSNYRYVVCDRVMYPFTAQQERKTRKDYGMREGRSSTSSSSAFGQPSSSHPNDDDDNDGNDEGTSHESTPSPTRIFNSLSNDISQIFSNPPDIDPNMEAFYTHQSKIFNRQVQLRDKQRGGIRDSVQLETVVNTISHEYLLEFTSEYGISEMLHPELPGPGDRVVDFPEGKVGWMYFSKRPGKNTPQCYTKPLDSLKNWNNRFFWVDECVFPTAVDWRTNAPKDGMLANGTYFVEAVRALDTHRTPIKKQPEMLLCLVEMDLFSLIRALNQTKVKTGSRPHAPHELPLLTLTTPCVIKMDEPAAAMDSSGVPSTIERSPLDFAHEVEVSCRDTAAPEIPPPEDVPVTTAPGIDQAVEIVAVEPSVVRESRKRGYEGIDANAPPKSLRRDHADLRPSGAPTDVSDPDPLAFADAPSPHPADVVQFEQEAKLLQKSVAQVARRDQRIQARESEIKNLEALLETEAGMKRAAEEKSAGLSQELERMHFDEELYPRMLTAIAGRMWVIGHGLRLAMMKCAESLEMRQAFADVVSAEVAKGMSESLKHGVEHGYAQRTVESLEAYDPETEAKFATALQSLKDLKYPLLDQLEGLKDAPMDVIMAALYLESDTGGMPHNLYATSAPAPLSTPSRYTQSRAEQKKRSRIVCRTHGVGSAHHARSDRVPVSAPIVVPQGLALLLVDAATQTEYDA
nr:retrovirus-related Pol polyprotein from transposon TNT 1-94 [Tanacetum cinerariifolium]